MRLHLDPKPSASATPPMDAAGRHQGVGYWHETIEAVPGEPLAESISCDVAIVGGGYTGLSTAWYLKKHCPDLDVVVLEAAVVGHGASGRNGGFVMPLLGWDLLYTVKKLGDETARDAYQLMYEAVNHVKQVIGEDRIDCDLETTGYVLLNTSEARERRSRLEYETARRLGFDHEWLEGDALAAHIRSDCFRSGVFDPHACVVNPAKLARGMKAQVEAMGVRVYERSPLLDLEEGAPVRLRTEQGTVRATQVMLAVNGYGAALGFMESRIMPVHTFIVLTEPLRREQLDAVGWGAKRASLESARNLINYFRLTADNRILFGGEDAKLYYGGRYYDHDDAVSEALKTRFRAYFPPLEDVAFTHEWGGLLGVSLDMFPSSGVVGSLGNIFYAGGYSGHGVALSNYAGALVAPAMLEAAGRQAPDAPRPPFFYGRRPAWVGHDPVRYLGVQAYRYVLRAQDHFQGA